MSDHFHVCPKCEGTFGCEKDDCKEIDLCCECELSRLKEELERERMRLCACGVAADSNTPDSLEKNLLLDGSPYFSASYEQVVRMVRREMALREENGKLREELEKERESRHEAEGEWVKCKHQLEKANKGLAWERNQKALLKGMENISHKIISGLQQELEKAKEDLKIQRMKLRKCIYCEYFLPLKVECAFTPHPCDLEETEREILNDRRP